MGSINRNTPVMMASGGIPNVLNGDGFEAPKGGLLGSFGKIGEFTGPTGGAPVSANIQQATSVKNVQDAQRQALYGMSDQDKLLAALKGQNGLGIQNNVANQLQGIVSGQGYNPAMAMLNQQTGQNIQNQAAMMAGQRGSGANAGLMARQAGQMGGNMQQQAVGQGAVMQANQSLNALNSLQGLGNTMAGQQIGQTNANVDARMANQQMLQNSLAGVNQARVANQGNLNQGNVGLANAYSQYKSSLTGGVLGGAGSILGTVFAKGGEVKMADGGPLTAPMVNAAPRSAFGKYLSGASQISYNSTPIDTTGPGMAPQPSISEIAGMFKSKGSSSKPTAPAASTAPAANMAEGGVTDSYKSVSASAPSGGYESEGGGDNAAADMATIAQIAQLFLAKGGLAEEGGHVKAKNPAQKAEVPGNSYANDKIPAKLSEGEIVLPREVTMSDDPIKASAEFVAKVLSEKKATPKKNFAGGDIAISENQSPESPAALTSGDPAAAINQSMEDPAILANAQSGNQSMEDPSILAKNQEEPSAQLTPDDHINEYMKRAQDMASGDVSPESYHSLWAKKDTLGKIGTLFGLMASGIGSGLTGQPNTFMHMMDKQIERDFEAQKKNKENARNFITTMTDTAGKGSALTEQQLNFLQSIGVDTTNPKIRDYAVNKFQQTMSPYSALWTGKQAVADYIDKKAQASGNPNLIGLSNQYRQHIDQTALNELPAAVNHASKEAQTAANEMASQDPDNVFSAAAIKGSKMKSNAIVPGAIAKDDIPVVGEEVKKMKLINEQHENWKKAFEELKKVKGGGEASFGAKIVALAGKYAAGNQASAQEAEDLAMGPVERARNQLLNSIGVDPHSPEARNILPGWQDLDSDKSIARSWEAGQKYWKQKQDSILNIAKKYGEGKNPLVPGLYHKIEYEPYKGGSYKASDASTRNSKAPTPPERPKGFSKNHPELTKVLKYFNIEPVD